MRNVIQCLMVSGPQMDNGLRTAIYLAACKQLRGKGSSIKFRDENGEGGVSTKHRRRSVSSFMTGIEFEATVEHQNGTTKCRFLVNDIGMPKESEVLKNYSWFPMVPFSAAADEGEEWKKA